MNNFDKNFEDHNKTFKRLFKIFVVLFVCVIVAVFSIWGGIAYLVVSKGPETVHRAERAVDAYTNRLEQEVQKNDQKSE